MDVMRFRHLALALSAAVWLTGCATFDNTFRPAAGMPGNEPTTPGPSAHLTNVSMSPPTDTEKDVYAALFPFYAELCAVSEIDKKPGFGAPINGGFGGHSVLYLNGVCREADAGYPTIKICDGAPDGSSAAIETRGVGLSVNDHFKNTNWVATEGKDFLFYGALQPGDRVTVDGYRRTQDQAMKMGILDGVQFHGRFFDKMPPGMSRRAFMYEISISTDYAINFGRDRYCGRVPLNRAQMTRVVTYLNEVNQPYRAGKKKFQWDVLRNNCSHLTHNALAAAGIWDEVGVEQSIIVSALDFPVPKNEFVNLMQRTNDLPLDNLLAIYRDDGVRDSLMTQGRLPMRPGALVELGQVMQQNDIYDTKPRLIFYDPIGSYQRAFEAILADPRYIDLRTNLAYFASTYQHLKATQKPLSWYLARADKIPGPGAEDFAAFYQRFYQSIDHESLAIDSQMAALDHPSSPGQPVMMSSSVSTVPGATSQ
jgi:hypothetical protein